MLKERFKMKKTNLLITVIVSVALLSGIAYLLHDHLGMSWNGYGGYHMRTGMMGFGGMGIMMLLFWGLVLIVMDSGKCYESTNSLNAIDLLKKRYANGEIDKAEFEIVKRDLQ
jgi:uncharacterized membrane protein